MKNKNFINQSLWAGSSPNQTGETFTRENRHGVLSYFYRTFVLLFMLLTLGVGQMWADMGFFKDGQWKVGYNTGGESDTWTDYQNKESSYDIGIVTSLTLKGCNAKTWENGGWSVSQVDWFYSWSSGVGTYKEDHSSVSGSSDKEWYCRANRNLISIAPNNPGNNTLYMFWEINEWSERQSGNSSLKFTIPGFKTTSTSQSFSSTVVDGESSTTKISFGNHYGTALTTGNCSSLTDFTVTAIDETGVTVKFTPKSAGSKSETLTITDAHGKTCSITLTGKTKVLVTYQAGTYGSGSNQIADKVYDEDLTLADKGYFTRTGYTQTAWNTNADGTSGTSYALNDTYSNEAELTLYPTWTQYTITEVSISPDEISPSTPTDITFSFTTNAPTNDGYKFRIKELTPSANAYGAGYEANDQTLTKTSPTAQTYVKTAVSRTAGTYKTQIELYKGDWSIATSDITLTVGSGGGGGGSSTWYWIDDNGAHNGSEGGITKAEFTETATAGVYTLTRELTQNQQFHLGDGSKGYGPQTPANSDHTNVTATSSNINLAEYGPVYWFTFTPATQQVMMTLNTNASPMTLSFSSPSYTITYKDQGDVTYSGTNGGSLPSSYTYGTGIATLTAGVKAGYTFDGWYDNPSCTGDAVTSIGTTATGAKTLYAKWTERMSVLTTSNHYNVGNPSYAAPTVSGSATDVGYETTRTITAAAAGTGYRFVGWTLTNCTRTDGGGDTANPITIHSNGDGAAASVVANYEEVLSTEWKIIGQSSSDKANSPFSSWTYSSSTNTMAKATGHSTESVAYATISVPAASVTGDYYEFKVSNGTTHYGFGTSEGYYILFNETKTDQSVYSNDNNDHALRFKPNVAGDYTFKMDYSSNPKKVSVTFPVSYTVTYGVGTSCTSMGSVSTSPSISSGAYVIEGTEITFTATPNPGYKFVGWYDNAAYTGDAVSTDASYTIASLSATTTLYAKFDYRPLYIQADWLSWGTAAMTQSTENRAVYTYEIDNVVAQETSASSPYNNGYHFRFMNANNGGNEYLAYNYDGVQTPTGSGFLTNSDIHKTDVGNQTIQYNLTRKSKITITLTLQSVNDATKPTVNIAADPYYTVSTAKGGSGAAGISISPTSVEARSGANSAEITATIDPGYTFTNWTADPAIDITSPNATTTTVRATGDGTLTANATANSYTVNFNGNGNTGGSTSDMPAQTYGDAFNLTSNGFTKTGYTFAGWATEAAGAVVYTDGQEVSNLTTENNGTVGLYAKWTANGYTVELDIEEDHHGSLEGKTTSQSVTYDAATVTVPNLPKGADGYALMGYFTEAGGEGTKLINADGTWIASVEGYTDGSTNWVHDGNVTLYAYYKKSEITELAITPSTAALSATVTVVPTLFPQPDGATELCWRLLRSNDNEITGVTFSPASPANAVSFTAPNASGTYKVACILRTGTVCGGGTVLDSVVQSFVVAGEHTVNVHYQDASGRTLAASTEVTGRPLTWSEDITAPTIIGYTFTRWEAGDGITIKDGETSSNPTHIEAAYAGDLTAIYSKKNMIYFNNTLGWSDVYVYFYNTDEYWDNTYGSGAQQTQEFNGDHKPYWEQEHGQMTRIEGTNIWYFDYTGAGYTTRTNVVFTEADQHAKQWFWQTNVVRRGDHKSSLPMFVPLTTKTSTKNECDYYNEGYWMNYPDNTGYTLKIYNGTGGDEPTLQSIPFEFNEDKTLPMELAVELNANRTYGFEIYRNDGQYLGISGTTFKNGDSGDEGETVRATNTNGRTGLQTSVAGEYIFKLNFGNSSGYKYLLGVHYPVAVGSYRIVYTESGETLWSGHPKPSGWHHPSRSIEKKDGAKDIVSFYVKQDAASMKFQYASAVDPETGAVTWTDVTGDGGTIDLSDITSSGVYNFHLTQTADAISVEKIEPYTGNYYIRTDNAGTTKWDNYRAEDHQMTYSEFSKDRATNTFGELYTHYYMHWCPRGTNIKFVIANDYSMCITDTLENDVVSLGNMLSAGWLNSDNASEVYRDRFSANIRFMYDERTNKISRAYMSSSTNTDRKFLVLKSNTEFKNSDGTDLTGSGESRTAGNYEAIFKDNEDWIYEREIKLTPGQKFKLYASYAQETVKENGSQHFRGNYAGNDWENTENYVELVGGTGAACNARIVYDFKTNRLMSAYVPDNDNPIEGSPSINADIMIVRNHQDAGQQITFTSGSSLNAVKTVYGVMRFNRWILNNRQHPEDMNHAHSTDDTEMNKYHPLITDPGSQKSADERGLYWISFPFDVNLSEVFGFGTYGTHWIILTYNGEERARQGYWADSEGFWEYIWDRKGVVLEKGKGYVLALELGLMQANNRTFWNNEIQQVELFFPSTTSSTGTIQETDVDIDVPEWTCSIDRRTDKTKPDWNKDRRIADSHWNIIGVPSYANYNKELTDGSSTITWNNNPETEDLPFLYEWNANDNTYTVQSGTNYPFKAMHSYYVQYHGRLHWSLASATPASVASRTYAEAPRSEEFRLEFLRNDKMEDQTFVKLSNDENASANFVFGEDMIKEKNATRANIYTIVENYLPVAGNTLPMSEQTTVVPVGVKIKSAGDYTFSIPEGTDGIGITLVDNETGVRTLLSALDYTIHLEAGTYDQRFILEISPIYNTPTGLEEPTSNSSLKGRAQKVMVDGVLYIVKDGKIFDARGVRLR